MSSSIKPQSREERLGQHRAQRLPVVFASAGTALQSAFLLNGGGAIALLALLGQLFQAANPNPLAKHLATPLFIFVLGAAIAGIATGTSFLAQYGYLMRRQSWFGKRASTLTKLNFFLVAISHLCFILAAAVGYCAIR